MAATSFDQVIANLEKERQEANVANQQRYEQMQVIFDEIISRYRPGGAFEAQFEQQLGTRKERDVGQAKQDLISSGLFGTERLAGTGRQWEAEVGAPARLGAQDLMMQRLSNAQLGKASAIERVSDTGPDYATIANLAMQAGQQPSGVTYAGSGSRGLDDTAGYGVNVRGAPTMQEQMDMQYRQAQRMSALQGGSTNTTDKTTKDTPAPTGDGRQYYIPGYNNGKPLSPAEYMPLLEKWRAAGGQKTGKTLGEWLTNQAGTLNQTKKTTSKYYTPNRTSSMRSGFGGFMG